MSRHRSPARGGGRGIARWPLVTAGLVLVLALAWLGWSRLGELTERRSAAQAASCPQGQAVLPVAVEPSLAQAMSQVAQAWNASRPLVSDHCMRAEVRSVAALDVLDGLAGEWDTSEHGQRPSAWLTDSSLWVQRLDPSLLGAGPESVATSPVVLAMLEPAADAMLTAGPPDWSALPELADDPESWSEFGRPEWGRLEVALPDVAGNPASTLALQAVLAGVDAPAAGPVTAQMLAEPPVREALDELADADQPESTGAALETLAEAGEVTQAPFDGVPVLEYDLYRRNTAKDGRPASDTPLVGVTLAGPTPVADFPFVVLAGDGADRVQVEAAQNLRNFLGSEPARAELARAGLRVPGSQQRPSHAPGVRWAEIPERLTPASPETVEEILAAWEDAVERAQQ